MTAPIDRKKLGADPVGDVLDLFLDGWKVFSDSDYTVFRGGKVLRIGEQAYADGVFTITKKAAFGSSQTREEVHLWRCIMVTGYAHSVEAMNIGVPVWSGGGRQYIETHVPDWMSDFRLLRDEKEAVS
jgi:hypothetical protein